MLGMWGGGGGEVKKCQGVRKGIAVEPRATPLEEVMGGAKWGVPCNQDEYFTPAAHAHEGG